MILWNTLFRPVLFSLPAETAHHLSMSSFTALGRIPGIPSILEKCYGQIDERLKTTCMGLTFPSPIGLAAGFDKDARWFDLLGNLGFGSIEIGSVTGKAQPGNPTPRLFRLPKDRAIINRMGFNSRGADWVAEHLGATKGRLSRFRETRVLGINLGKTKSVPNEMAVEDYEYSLQKLFPFGDYFVVNVSSPNTAGLRDLQQKEMLRTLVDRLSRKMESLAQENGIDNKPLIFKIAPDLTEEQIDDVAELVLESSIAGVIATNTTIHRQGLVTNKDMVESIGTGGLSGQPLRARSLEVVKQLAQRFRGKKTIIGVGGVFDGHDAWRYLRAGASLVQLYTGFVYGGPGTVNRIHSTLLELMRQQESSGSSRPDLQ